MAESLERLKAATCLVTTPTRARGTGYLIAPTLVATCHHVVQDCVIGDPIEAVFAGGKKYPGTVFRLDERSDCALLRLDAAPAGASPMPLAGGPAGLGAWTGCGYPKLASVAVVPLVGDVLDPTGNDDLGKPALVLYSPQIAAGMASPIHGFSGSPVMMAGVVVGHLARILSDPDKPERPALGQVYATPASAVRALAGDEIGAPPAPATPSLAAATPPALAEDEHHVFISYRSTDRAWVLDLATRLEGLGLRVYLDQLELDLSDAATAERKRRLARSRTAIAVMSAGWLAAPWSEERGETLLARAAGDPAFRLEVARLDDIVVPARWAGRAACDFGRDERPEGPRLDALVRGLDVVIASPSSDPEARQREAERAAVDEILAHLRAAAAAGATPLFRAWEALSGVRLAAGAAAITAAELLLRHARPELALRVLDAAKPSTRASQLRALALDRTGRSDEAIELLAGLGDAARLDAESGGLLGGRYKARWLRTENVRWLRLAHTAYREAYDATGHGYPGINAAATALQLDEMPEARSIAQALVASLGQRTEAQLDHYDRATLAEAYLILDDLDQARRWYRSAVGHPDAHAQEIAVMRRGARQALRKLHGPEAEHRLDAELPVSRVVAYTGHITDAPGRADARFPPEREGAVRLAIRARLRALDVGHGHGSLARGADILFIEELLAREARAVVVLPFPAQDFKQISVGEGWDDRFDRLLADPRVEVRAPLHDARPPPAEQDAAFQECNVRMQDEAVALAQTLDETPVLLAVMHGEEGARGGTADAVQAWRARGLPVEVIDPMTELPPRPC